MAISKVKVISIIGITESLDEVVTRCGASQVFHPDNALSFYSDTKAFSPITEQNPFEEPLETVQKTALSVGLQLKPTNTLNSDTNKRDIREFLSFLSSNLGDMLETRRKIQETIEENKRSLSGVTYFVGQSLNLGAIKSCEYIKVRFGRLPRESYHKLNSYAENDYILFCPCTKDATHYFGVYFCPIEKLSIIDRIFSELYFEELDVMDADGTPEEKVTKLRNQINNSQTALYEINQKIESFVKAQKEKWAQVYTKIFELKTYYDIKKYAYKYNESFILVGWIPQNSEKEIAASLDQIGGVDYTIEDAKSAKGHSPPVQLKNKRLFKPFEFFVDMYGLPSYNEIDPTAFVAITYTLLFGIMFGDIGQGAIISILGYLAFKFKKMSLGKILIPCGFSSMLFGTVYGSVFGFEHVLDPLYSMLFGIKEKPIEVMQPQTANVILCSAIGLGIVLVLIAMLINIYSSLRRRRFTEGLFGQNGIAGLLFYSGLIFGFAGQLLGIPVFSLPYVLAVIILPLLCILLEDPLGKLLQKDPNWKPKSWGAYLMQSFFEVFEVILSYITNTLSFLRVGAFVLVHAGMMMIFSTLAAMSGIAGSIIFMLLGNIIVIGLEGFLVGIQVLRLEFYEMFIRFFEGQGVPFNPVAIKTKDTG